MLGKRLINTGGVGACTTDTIQILDAGTTESTALYRFEDNAFDTSGSLGYINKGAYFNGGSSIALTAGSFTYTAPFSIAAWIKQPSQDSSDIILENYDYQSSTSRGFIFRTQSGKLRFDGYYSDATRTEAKSNESIPLNTWTHVACVWDNNNSSIKLYINGSEATYSVQTFNAMQYHSTAPVTIGALNSAVSGSGEQFFVGSIDELRIYDDALTATEIGYIANNTTASIPTGNLAAHYQFEGNSNDSTSNPINGTATNVIYDYDGAASNVTYTTGKFGKAAVFNGSSSKIDIANLSNTFGQKTSYTVSAWFKMSASGNNAIFDDYNYANQNLGLYLYDGVMNFFARYNNSDTSGISSGSTTYHDDNWHHVVATSDQTTGKLYVDGQLVASGAMPSTSYSGGSTSPSVGIGRQQHPGSSTYSWFNGSIDQVRIFTEAITAAQVTALYNETTTTAALATIDRPSTIAYYKMQDATDETGSYDGTATNVNFNIEGKYGFAGLFNGSNSYIDISSLDFPTNDFSVSAWVYLNSTPGSTTYNMILTTAKQNSGGYFYFTFYGTQLQYYHVASSTSVIGGTVAAGQWNHVVLTQSSTNGAKVYLNASVAASNTSLTANNTPNTTSGGVNTLGYYNTGSSTTGSLNGRMDQVRIFNKAISASEVTKLYNEIQCPNTITDPESYFNTVLFTPTTSTSALPVTGVGFTPDLIWAKYRGTGSGYSLQSHYWYDTVRGTGSRIFSNSNSAESTTSYVQSFDTDGITYVNNLFNRTGADSVVGWFWKAGGAAVSASSKYYINVEKSVADEAGFSIVRFDFPFTPGGNALVPNDAYYEHGLSKRPDLIITKSYSGYLGAADWYTWASPLGAGTNGLRLNNDSDGIGQGYFGTIDSTKAEFRFSSNNINGLSGVVTYNFRNIDGYQRIGSYVGNNSTVGPFVYTGFEPAWVMIKEISNTGSWIIHDNKRSTTNPRANHLRANSNAAEDTGSGEYVNFLTNGFQLAGASSHINNNNEKYLFWAIAANPDTSAPTKANSFNTLLYTGNDSNNRDITGLGFKPDFLWIKRRGSEPHALYDSVRGPNLQLTTHDTDAEATNSGSYLGMSSFDADGFNVGNNGGTNRAPHAYVAWAWKGLDHDRNLPQINNDGSITSLVSANIAAGFSIVSYRGNATSGATVGHGLGGELDFLIVKSTNLTQAWNVYVKGVTNTNAQYLRLNEPNNIYTTVNPRFIPGNFNDNVFSIGSDNACNGNNDDYIAYCFRSISGYSKVGTYTGAGSSGKTIATGFQPRFILIKRIDDSSNNTSWAIYDSERGGTKPIRPNTSGDETSASTTEISFTSTGISIPTSSTSGLINESGDTYIYLAIS